MNRALKNIPFMVRVRLSVSHSTRAVLILTKEKAL